LRSLTVLKTKASGGPFRPKDWKKVPQVKLLYTWSTTYFS